MDSERSANDQVISSGVTAGKNTNTVNKNNRFSHY